MNLNHPILAPRVFGLERDPWGVDARRDHPGARPAPQPVRLRLRLDRRPAKAALARLAAQLRRAGLPVADVTAERG